MEKIYKYIEDHASCPSEALEWIVRQTHIRTNHARMLSGAAQGQFLRMLVQMTGASRILELGTFTGYSAVCLASGLPEDGRLDTLELNDELEDLILEGFVRAGLSEKIELHIGDCKETLMHFRQEDRQYDVVYIDANKREYCEYYDLVFDMVRPGGLILADNVLWDGKVCQDPLPQDRQTLGIVAFNDRIASDPRVESVIIPLRDGLNVIRKTAGRPLVTARQLLEKAEQFRRECRFGDAVNTFREAASAPDATEELKNKALASVELIQEINGFVNADLMNP